MLEEQIAKLTASIDELNASILEMNNQITQPVKMFVTDAAPALIATKTPQNAQGEAQEVAPLSAHGAEVILLEDLTKICMEIVRKNKTDKDKIKRVLEKYHSTLLKEVPLHNYADLKKDLLLI